MISVTVDVDLPGGRLSLTEYVEESKLNGGTGDEIAAMALLARLVRAVGARYGASITEALGVLRSLADAAGTAVGRTEPAPERDWTGEIVALARTWESAADEYSPVIAAQLRSCATVLYAMVDRKPGEQVMALGPSPAAVRLRKVIELADAWERDVGETQDAKVRGLALTDRELIEVEQVRRCARELRAVATDMPIAEQVRELAEELTDEQKRAGMLPEDMLS